MTTPTRPGDVLAGRYRLIDLLTESGDGRFWRAHDDVLERYVALHAIAEDDPRAPGLLAAARESATVLDARILRVLDASVQDGSCFVVNEWGTGTSLDILVTHGGPLGPRRAAWLTAEVAGAIATAHSQRVAHGRLSPENVLIDRMGAVRLIGLCVDAALHGLPAGRLEQDRQDLAGLLYCALTASWPGPSESMVPAAPHAHDAVLSPRRVRAGVPKPLDLLWTEITETAPARRRRPPRLALEVATASAVRDRLLEFLGDADGLSEALAASIPPINEVRPVVLPQVPEITVRDVDPPAEADESPGDVEGEADSAPIPSVADIVDRPTEAGMPVFADADDEVAWMRARSTSPPPPPPFDEPPERPLFAPEPPGGAPARRARTDAAGPAARNAASAAAGFWPWEPGSDGPDSPDGNEATSEGEVVPGRSWLRLAMAVAACLAVLLGVAVAFNLGRGRTPLGDVREEPTSSPTLTTPAEPSASPLTDVVAGAFDPLGTDGGENDDRAALAVDGDPSTDWSTSTYRDQLGPTLPALKAGVGLYVDLGVAREVDAVELDLVGAPTDVEVYVSDEAPTSAPEGAPVASDTVPDAETTLPTESAGDVRAAVTGRYVLVWFTSLPAVPDGFEGGVAEVVVRGR